MIFTNETLVDIAAAATVEGFSTRPPSSLHLRWTRWHGQLNAMPGSFGYKLKCRSEATPENYKKSSMLSVLIRDLCNCREYFLTCTQALQKQYSVSFFIQRQHTWVVVFQSKKGSLFLYTQYLPKPDQPGRNQYIDSCVWLLPNLVPITEYIFEYVNKLEAGYSAKCFEKLF